MSRYMNKSAFNKSFANASFHSKQASNLPSVIIAKKKLKEEQDRIYQANGRYKVLHRHISRNKFSSENKQRQDIFCTAVKRSAQMDKEIKLENEKMKIEQLKQRFSINIKNRDRNKRMIENVKRSFQQTNHSLYEQIRMRRAEDDLKIRTSRFQYLEEKIKARKKASEEKDMRRQSIQNFYQSRISTFRQSKEEEVNELLSLSNSKHRHLDKLVSRNSQVSYKNLSLSNSSCKSLRNPQKDTITPADQ